MKLPNCYRCGNQPCTCADGCTIYHADCRDVLPLLEPGSVDVVVTDPPYGIVNKFGTQVRGKGKGTRKLQFSWDDAEAVGQAVGQAVGRCNRPTAAVVFCGLDTVSPVQESLRNAGLIPKPLAWVKKCPVPPMKGNWWPSAFELGIYAYETGAWFGDDNPRRCNVFIADSLRYGQPDKNGHPTQKPIALMRWLNASIARPDKTVIDPFLGSGTTLRACKDLGRRGIGIEIEERYCEIAARRLEQGVLF